MSDPLSSVGCMDDGETRVTDTASLCALVSERHHSLVRLECELLELAALWADHHSELAPRDTSGHVLPGAEHLKVLGGDGTPLVWEFAPAEFGALQQMSVYSASHAIADALDLRHRLPLIWTRVRAGEVRVWTARKVALATRSLSKEAAGFVDRAMAGCLAELPWGRCERRLAGKIIEADPEAAEANAKAAAADRFVRTGRSEDGFTTIFARATAGDAIWLDATVDRIAEILALRGDTDARDVRRSKALGIVAQPAKAVLLLADYEDAIFTFEAQPELGDSGIDDGGVGDSGVEDEGSDRDADGDPVDVTDADLLPDQRETTPAEDRAKRNELLVREHLRRLKPADLLPPVTLYLHLHAHTLAGHPGAVRFEDVGAVTLEQLKGLLSGGCSVRIQPVLDLDAIGACDAYEAPERMREALRLRSPAEVSPYGTNLSRNLDFDHTVPYRPPESGGPPGQTRIDNAGFLGRRAHRIRTHGRWQLRQPEPGSYLWRSPHGWFHLVNATGTHTLGSGSFAQQVWAVAAPAGVDVAGSGRELGDLLRGEREGLDALATS